MSNGIAGVLTYSVTNVLKCGLKSKKMGNLMIKNSKYWPRNLSRVGKKIGDTPCFHSTEKGQL